MFSKEANLYTSGKFCREQYVLAIYPKSIGLFLLLSSETKVLRVFIEGTLKTAWTILSTILHSTQQTPAKKRQTFLPVYLSCKKRVMEGQRRIFQHFSIFLNPSILPSKPKKYTSVVRTFTFPFDKVFYKEDRWNWYFTIKERKKTVFAEK